MARKFNGTDEGLQSGLIDLTGTDKVTLAFMLYWDVFASGDDLAFEFSDNYNPRTDAFIIDPNAGSIFSVGLKGNAGYNTAEYTRPSAAAWHHYVCIFDTSQSTNEVDLYIDGDIQTPSSRPETSNSSNNFGNYNLNFMCRNQISLFAPGRMAEVALYPIRLTSDEAAALGDRGCPLKVRPESLLRYWPLGGVYDANDGDHDLIAGDTLTQTNAPTTSDHPIGMKYPSQAMGQFISAPAVGFVPSRVIGRGILQGVYG